MSEELELLELSAFDGLVGETFVFTLDGTDQSVEGVLAKAEASGSDTAPGIERVPFVLDFTFPPGSDIGQCLLNARTAGGKEFPPMFLVPRGADDDGWYMDATFN